MDWAEIHDWPNGHLSKRVTGPVHRWHVQQDGRGMTLLMLHGAGGSTHSFRHLFTELAKRFHVIALDLPGHGFTQLGARHRSSLDQIAEDITTLCRQEGWVPEVIVGHSAGGPVALRLAEPDLRIGADAPLVIGLNAAMSTFKGVAGLLFPAMAKALSAVPFTASLFSSASANPERIKALIASTGSDLDAEGLDLYRRLVTDRNHVDGTLKMMAQWRLNLLLDRLPDYNGTVHFVVGQNDKTVRPLVSETAAQIIKGAHLHHIPKLGHLMHEEQPAQVAEIIHTIIDNTNK